MARLGLRRWPQGELVDFISISPSTPDSWTPVTITFEWYGCYRGEGFERTGNTFTYFYDRESRCAATAPGGTVDIGVGRLDTGVYQVRYEFLVDGELLGVSTRSFAVAAAPAQAAHVPATDFWSGCTLALALLVGAAVHWRRVAA